MITLKKITIVTGIAVALLVGPVMGGVEVNAISPSKNRENYNRMMRYLNYEQPAQIKKDLNKTIKKYRNQNKKYKQESFEPTQNYLYKRFSVDRNKLTSNQQVSMAHAFICTEFYLAAVINNAYYVPDTCTPIIQRNFGIYIQNKVYKE